jgi:hypothetical protein
MHCMAMAYDTQWIRPKHITMAVDAINCINTANIPQELHAPGYVAGRRRIAARTETSGPASQLFPTKSKRSSATRKVYTFLPIPEAAKLGVWANEYQVQAPHSARQPKWLAGRHIRPPGARLSSAGSRYGPARTEGDPRQDENAKRYRSVYKL